jgi:hypothetical protein
MRKRRDECIRHVGDRLDSVSMRQTGADGNRLGDET